MRPLTIARLSIQPPMAPGRSSSMPAATSRSTGWKMAQPFAPYPEYWMSRHCVMWDHSRNLCDPQGPREKGSAVSGGVVPILEK